MLKIGKYKLTKRDSIPKTDQVNVLWIEKTNGEGMSIDLDKLWKEKY